MLEMVRSQSRSQPPRTIHMKQKQLSDSRSTCSIPSPLPPPRHSEAAFAARPHAAAGTDKAAEGRPEARRGSRAENGDVVGALKAWEPGQLELGRKVLFRDLEAGKGSQFDSTYRNGDPLPFGLYKTGDSSMALA